MVRLSAPDVLCRPIQILDRWWRHLLCHICLLRNHLLCPIRGSAFLNYRHCSRCINVRAIVGWSCRQLQLMLVCASYCGWRWQVYFTPWPLYMLPACCLCIGVSRISMQSLESSAVLLKMTRLPFSIIIEIEVHLARSIEKIFG